MVFQPLNLCGISSPFGELSPTTGQIAYALLSRPPLTRRSVRLACIKRAASVRPEPGSNPHENISGLKLALFLKYESLALPSTIQLLRCPVWKTCPPTTRRTNSGESARSQRHASPECWTIRKSPTGLVYTACAKRVNAFAGLIVGAIAALVSAVFVGVLKDLPLTSAILARTCWPVNAMPATG